LIELLLPHATRPTESAKTVSGMKTAARIRVQDERANLPVRSIAMSPSSAVGEAIADARLSGSIQVRLVCASIAHYHHEIFGENDDIASQVRAITRNATTYVVRITGAKTRLAGHAQ
jgi:hypothetical protein